jgi:hypothetical protein
MNTYKQYVRTLGILMENAFLEILVEPQNNVRVDLDGKCISKSRVSKIEPLGSLFGQRVNTV